MIKPLDDEFYIKYHTLAGYLDILQMIDEGNHKKLEGLNLSYIKAAKEIIETLNEYLLHE